MIRSTLQSLLCRITHIEAIVLLIKDDFLHDHLIPDLNTINSINFELESLRNFVYNQNTGCINKARKVD